MSKTWRPFPELKLNEIVPIMEELRIPVAETDITKPSPTHVMKIYEQILELFTGVQLSSVLSQQPKFAILDLLEYPDLHNDSISLMIFYKHISKFAASVGIEDFSLKDILKPEAPRLKMILSGIINFAKFREEQLTLFDDFSSKADEILLQRKKAQFRYQEVQTRLSKIEEQSAQEAPLIASLTVLKADLLDQIKSLKRDQTTLMEGVDGLKKSKDEVSDKLASQQFILVNLKQEIQKMETRVVSNPELLISTVKSMQEELAGDKAFILSCEKRNTKLQTESDNLLTLEHDISRCISQMEECLEALRKKKEFDENVSSEKENIMKRENYRLEIQQKELQLKRQLTSIEEKTEKLYESQSTKRADHERSLKISQDDYDTLAHERVEVKEKISKNEKLIKDMETKLNELRKSHDIEIGQLQQAFQGLCHQIGIYHMDIRKYLTE